ncbi:MAG: hypothetical protein ACYTGN_09535 [Planctomycetota bacterium]
MRTLGRALGALLIGACAHRGLPEPGLELAADPPPDVAFPTTGIPESDASREIRLVARAAERSVVLHAFCRVDVWTTLQEIAPERFVVRESWSRLGEREPRLLRRVEDDVVGGIVVRLRPERDGSLSFVIEASSASVGPKRKVGAFFGADIELALPRRHGYLFVGRAPPGYDGVLAAWPGAVQVGFAEATETAGLLVGAVRAEAFVEEWAVADPVPDKRDGIESVEYRLTMRRKAAGFSPDGEGWYKTYGASLDLRPDSGAVRFVAGAEDSGRAGPDGAAGGASSR